MFGNIVQILWWKPLTHLSEPSSGEIGDSLLQTLLLWKTMDFMHQVWKCKCYSLENTNETELCKIQFISLPTSQITCFSYHSNLFHALSACPSLITKYFTSFSVFTNTFKNSVINDSIQSPVGIKPRSNMAKIKMVRRMLSIYDLLNCQIRLPEKTRSLTASSE